MQAFRIPGLTILIISQLALHSQTIEITQYPDYGEAGLLYGKTDVANIADYHVACYIFVQEAGGWWGPKPSTINPLTSIAADGTFSLQFITGGIDEYCTRFFVCLCPISMPDPPFIGGGDLPDSLFVLPYDIVARPHGSRHLNWPNSDFGWVVKESLGTNTMGPGGNLFSASIQNIWVDDSNQLHMKIDYRDSSWYCAELIADTSFGYGRYSFVYNSNPDILDPKTVFGFFTWDDISPNASNPNDFYREIDFEFSRWGWASDPTNAQFVIQPWHNQGNLLRYDAGTNIGTIHSFCWYKDSVVFESSDPDSSMLKKWVYTGNNLPEPGAENLRINLWLTNVDPNHQDEIILGDYSFQYVLDAPANVSASKCSGDNISVKWDELPGRYYRVYRSSSTDFANAIPLTDDWFQGDAFIDTGAEKGIWYLYWLRCADNPAGSNTSGYLSNISLPDSGITCNDHIVSLPASWSGISSYINPIEDNLDSLFKHLGSDLIILQNQNGVYYPKYNMNTIGPWNPRQGYIIKTTAPSKMVFSGLFENDKSITLEQGWNLIPVLSECPVEIETLFPGAGPVVIKEVSGWRLWWPQKGIHTLTHLQPGEAYFILMNGGGEIIFPECP